MSNKTITRRKCILNEDFEEEFNLHNFFWSNHEIKNTDVSLQLPSFLNSNQFSQERYLTSASEFSRNVFVDKNKIAYIANGQQGILIVDVTEEPEYLGKYDDPSYTWSVVVHNKITFVTDSAGIKIVDVSNPSSMVLGELLLEWKDTYDNFYDSRKNLMYVTNELYGLTIIDVSVFSSPRIVGNFTDGSEQKRLFVDTQNSIAYVSYIADKDNVANGMFIIDVSDPKMPILINSTKDSQYPSGIQLDLQKNIAFLGDDFGLKIYDVGVVSKPVLVSNTYYSGPNYDLQLIKNSSYVCVAAGEEGLRIFDVTDINAPFQVEKIDTPGYSYGLFFDDEDRFFIADGAEGLNIIHYSVDIFENLKIYGKCEGTVGEDYEIIISVCNTQKECEQTSFNLTILQANEPDQDICLQSQLQIGNTCIDTILFFGIVGGSSFFILVFIVVIIVCIIIIFILYKKANRFNHIEGVDIILKEAELEQKNENSLTPKILIDKSSVIIDYKDIEMKKVIGKGGSFSTVYLVRWSGLDCAYKKLNIPQGDSPNFDEFENEVKVAASVNHPAILRFYGACVTQSKIGFLLEFCSNGDIPTFLCSYEMLNDKKYPLDQKVRLLKEIASRN